MSERIGAIETEYAGHKFRSRLEARWAVFFDSLKIEWRYETQGFEVDGARYLPDFYLPEHILWVEVKGDPDGLRKDQARMRVVLGGRSPIPGFVGCAGPQTENPCEGLLVLGEFPRSDKELVAHRLFTHSVSKGLIAGYAMFLPLRSGAYRVCRCGGDVLAQLHGVDADVVTDEQDDKGWGFEYTALSGLHQFPACASAYAAGRQARFEHGARGNAVRA